MQQRDGICEATREPELNGNGFSINTRLQPGAKAMQDRSRFNGFPAGKNC